MQREKNIYLILQSPDGLVLSTSYHSERTCWLLFFLLLSVQTTVLCDSVVGIYFLFCFSYSKTTKFGETGRHHPTVEMEIKLRHLTSTSVCLCTVNTPPTQSMCVHYVWRVRQTGIVRTTKEGGVWIEGAQLSHVGRLSYSLILTLGRIDHFWVTKQKL